MKITLLFLPMIASKRTVLVKLKSGDSGLSWDENVIGFHRGISCDMAGDIKVSVNKLLKHILKFENAHFYKSACF